MKHLSIIGGISLAISSCSQNTAMVETYKKSLAIENNYSSYTTLLASSTKDRVMLLEESFWYEVKNEEAVKPLVESYGVSCLLYSSLGKPILSEKYLEEIAKNASPKSNLWRYFFEENKQDLFYYRNVIVVDTNKSNP